MNLVDLGLQSWLFIKAARFNDDPTLFLCEYAGFFGSYALYRQPVAGSHLPLNSNIVGNVSAFYPFPGPYPVEADH